jgi:hypothetical protein
MIEIGPNLAETLKAVGTLTMFVLIILAMAWRQR